VSIIPDAMEPHARFALVVSANHSLIDGHDFYRLHKMLSSDATVAALDPARRQEIPGQILASMGGEPSLMARCPPGFLFRFLSSQMMNYLFPATKACGFYVSPKWIAAQKQKSHSLLLQDSGVYDPPFISSNDILCSSFCALTACDVAMVNVNFRGRVAGLHDEHVGNYEDLLCLTPGDYHSPGLIRKSVSGCGHGGFARAGEPLQGLPSNFQHASGATYAAVTNWETFAAPLALAGCAQELHLPLFDFKQSTPARALSVMVIFKPSEGKLGVMVAGKRDLIDAVMASDMVDAPLDVDM
jgi:hypothetical protein